MKAEIIEAAAVPKKPNYPYLGKSDDLIVLFNGDSKGIALNKYSHYHPGLYRSDWDESCFTPFTGTVQLSND